MAASSFSMPRRIVVASTVGLLLLRASAAVAQNTTAAPVATTAPRVELEWEGIFVLVAVCLMILSMALNLVGSLPALFFVSTIFATAGIISVEQLFLGFVNKGMLTIALMFVLVHPIAYLPRANWFVELIIGDCACGGGGGDMEDAPEEGAAAVAVANPKVKRVEPWQRAYIPRLKLLLFAFVVSPFVENVPHVSVMAPVVTKVCRKLNIPTSQMLLPMAYCVCTANFLIIGSASNLIIEAMMVEYGIEPIGFFELVPSNGPVALVLILYYLLAPPLLLPRKTSDMPDEYDDDDEAREATQPGQGEQPQDADATEMSSSSGAAATATGGTEAAVETPEDTSAGLAPAAASAMSKNAPKKEEEETSTKPSSSGMHISKTTLAGTRDFTVHFRIPKSGDVPCVGRPVRTVVEELPPTCRANIRLLFLLRRRSWAAAPGSTATTNEPTTAAADEDVTPSRRRDFDPDAYDTIVLDDESVNVDLDGGAERHVAATVEDAGAVIVERDDILVVGGDASQLRHFRHLTRLYWVVSDVPDAHLLLSGDAAVDPAAAHGRMKGRQHERITVDADWPHGLVTISAEQQQKSAPFALVIVAHDNPAVETRVSDNVFASAYQSSVMGVKSARGEHLWGRDMAMHIIRAGDTLFLRTTVEFLKAQSVHSTDFYLVDPIDMELDTVLTAHYVRVPACFKQLATTRVSLRGDTAYLRLPDWYQNLTLVVFLGVVAAAMAGESLPLLCAIGICILVILNLITVQQAVRYVDWNVYATGSFAFGIGYGMTESGLAAWMGQLLTDSGLEGYSLILLLYTLTALIGSIVSNRGAIQVMFPIAFAIFSTQEGDGMIAAAAAIANGAMGGFITPYGLTPALIVAGPGQYLPKHYLTFGGPLFVLYAVLGSLMICVTYDYW